MRYLPPFDLIRRMVEVSTVKGELRVSVSYDDFIKILQMMIAVVEVDEEWYLHEHADIARAINNGNVQSPRQHFIDDGYFEGRLPFPMPVDERWYLERRLRPTAFRRRRLPRGSTALRDLAVCECHLIYRTRRAGLLTDP